VSWLVGWLVGWFLQYLNCLCVCHCFALIYLRLSLSYVYVCASPLAPGRGLYRDEFVTCGGASLKEVMYIN
jgi:hypothetical protein